MSDRKLGPRGWGSLGERSQEFPIGLLIQSIDNIAKGAAAWAGNWTLAGAKAGPIAGALLSIILAYATDDEEEESKKA